MLFRVFWLTHLPLLLLTLCAVLCCVVLCCVVQACVIKVHMLMLAHLERLGDDVPAALQADLK
jgi:hypothetical protein